MFIPALILTGNTVPKDTALSTLPWYPKQNNFLKKQTSFMK